MNIQCNIYRKQGNTPKMLISCIWDGKIIEELFYTLFSIIQILCYDPGLLSLTVQKLLNNS